MIKKIKDKISEVPEKLQMMCLFRCAVGAIFFVAFIAIVISSRDLAIIIPPLFVGLYLVFDAIHIMYNCANGKYVVVEGICCEIEYSKLGRKIKSVVIQHENDKVKIPCSAPRKKYIEGENLIVYIPDSASVYDKDGYKYVNSFYLIDVYLLQQNYM